PPEDEPEPEEERRPRRRRDEEEDEDDRPRKKRKEPEPKPEHPDFDPIDPDAPRRRRRRADEDDKLTPAQRAALRAALPRAARGCKLVWLSFALFMFSMFLIIAYWFQFAFTVPSPTFVIAAGAIGAVYWTLGAVGVGLCLSGPKSPGHWGYGIAAA